MTANHLVFLVEEPSMEAFLRSFLPRFLPAQCTFEIHVFQGKSDLLNKLLSRLQGYVRWLPDEWRLFVVVDRDDEDCLALKNKLEEIAKASNLRIRSRSRRRHWQIVIRLAIEELEAWYFGDWHAVCDSYPRVSTTIPNQSGYRNSDSIRGGTWEAFERILKRSGYFRTGLRKIEAARTIGEHVTPTRSRSHSFTKLYEAIIEALSQESIS